MQENNFFNGLFQSKNPSKGTNQPPQRTKYQQLLLAFCFVGVLLYPFSFTGVIPLLVVQLIDKKEKAAHVYDMDYESFLKRGSSLFFSLAFLFSILNLLSFTLWIPRGYFSAYLFFPLNLLHTSLQFSWQTIVALVLGGCGMGSIFVSFSAFIAKRKVVSKEEERKQILQAKDYKKRKKEKFKESQRYTDDYERAYETAIETMDFALYEQLKKQFLLGTSEFGLPYIMDFDEFNQHALIPATTGSGKTVLLQLFVQYAAKFNMPAILIDGKGARDTLEAMQAIAGYYDKEVRAFTDDGDMRYNPVERGNDISIRDKLVTLAETESVFYSGAAKSLLQVTIQLLDEFKDADVHLSGDAETTTGIERSLPFVQKFLLPRNVLHLFADAILPNNPKLFEIEVEKKIERPKKKTAKEVTQILDDSDIQTENENQEEVKKSQVKDSKFRNIFQQGDTQPETETIVLNRETLDLDSYYLLLKRNLKYLPKNAETGENVKRKLFERLFIRYEHKDSPFYLYATSEALQNNLNMLLDSKLGELFDTKGAENKLDIQEIARQNEIVYVSLNGLIYKEYIRTLAQMLVGDVNYFASEMYRKNQSKGILVLFDEPASYLNEAFIDMVNKGRGAGVHAIFSPQTMADIAKLGDKLQEQLVGNVNTLIIGKTNETGEAEYWSNTMGTYEDIEVTSMIEQEEGYSDVGKADWTGERGTKRNVDRFKINPNAIKALRTGEFIVSRTAKNVDEPPQTVYVRNALDWLQKNKSNENK